MKQKVVLVTILGVLLGWLNVFAQPVGVGVAVGETIIWDEGVGADSYKVTWYPTSDPSNSQEVNGIFGQQYKFPEGSFIDNTQYSIEVRSVDCCAVESIPAIVKFFKKVGTGGDCCHKNIVKDKDSLCFVSVSGMSWFRPGGVVTEGCQ